MILIGCAVPYPVRRKIRAMGVVVATPCQCPNSAILVLVDAIDVKYVSLKLMGWPIRVENSDHKELLELDPEGGVTRFAGRRALLLDAAAMGILRQYLVDNFGFTGARTVLNQFGLAHGRRMAATWSCPGVVDGSGLPEHREGDGAMSNFLG